MRDRNARSAIIVGIFFLGVRSPLGICLFRDRFDPYWHEAVVASAELGTLAVISAFRIDAEPTFIYAPGHSVDLDSERGNGPGVDDIVRRD